MAATTMAGTAAGTVTGVEAPLAGRMARLLATLIDGAIVGVLAGIAGGAGAASAAMAANSDSGEVGVGAFILPGIMGLLILAVLIVQLVLLVKDGQTLGKKAMGIRIVSQKTGQNEGFVPNVLLRAIVNGVLSGIPFYSLVDILLIFRDDRRCLHDMLAGTVVVQAKS